MAVFRAGFCDPSVDTNVWCGNRVALLGIFMVYLCAVQSICLSSHSACFTYGTGELIVVTFCVESLLQALCCRLSDAAVCEFQLLVELYEHYYQRLVKRKEELYLTLPVELIETANLTCFSHWCCSWLGVWHHFKRRESQWVMHNVKWGVTNAGGLGFSKQVIFYSGNKHTHLLSSCCISAVPPPQERSYVSDWGVHK